VSLQPTTGGVIPFNFFAGLTPVSNTDLAWSEGYTYVITSIVISTSATSGSTTLTIHDAEGNARYQAQVESSSADFPQRINDQLWMVMGPNSGAHISADNGNAVLTIDGFALLPGQLPIW
jgi:hypothetical protein